MKAPEHIKSWETWPEAARRFYLGMIESEAVNGSIIVRPGDAARAADLLAAGEADVRPTQ